MKALYFNVASIIILLSIISCQESKKSDWQLIEEKENEELSKGIRNDTIFLGFYFGMTEDQVMDKFHELTKSGKIYTDRDGKYKYDFAFDYPSKATATFGTEYFQNKLFKFSLYVESDEISSETLLLVKLAELFCDKYGYDFIKQQSVLSEAKDDYNYIWIDGNREVELFQGITDVRIFYTDLIAKIQNDTEKKNLEEKKHKETTNDI